MLEIVANPPAVQVRLRTGTTGEPERILDVVDPDHGLVVSIVLGEDGALRFGARLAAPRIEVAGADAAHGMRTSWTP